MKTLSPAQLAGIVLFDLIVILALARAVGGLFLRFGQPRVVGEIVAGILLGPSLLGAQLSKVPAFLNVLKCDVTTQLPGAPKLANGDTIVSISQCVFPNPAKGVLSVIGTLALLLFMFLVGAEFNPKTMRGYERAVAITAAAAVAIPAALAFAIQPVLFTDSFVATKDSATGAPLAATPTSLSFTLFVGAMLAVTAFPVMARILQERHLATSKLGTIGIAAAAGVTVLMFLLASTAAGLAGSGGTSAVIRTWVEAIAYLGVMFALVRPGLAKVSPRFFDGTTLTSETVALLLIFVLASGFVADLIGINVIVGGFVAGIVLPDRERLFPLLSQKLSDMVIVFMLPVFLAYSGLNTDFRKLGWALVPGIALFLLAGIVGKLGGGAIGSRLGGLNTWESLTIGALMNCRGLLVLVVALVGVQSNVISPQLQVGAVVMALITTMMTGPSVAFTLKGVERGQ